MLNRTIFLVSLLCICGCATNPITGRDELMLFSEQQDVQIGRSYAPEIEKQLGGKIEDPVVQAFINRVGQRTVHTNYSRHFDYHFTAVNDKSVNAFALPGGYIFITRGMLEKLQTEAQLAAILSHETIHVVARDTMNVMSNQIGIEILLSAVISKDTPRAAVTAAQLTRRILSLSYSREDEKLADLGGLDYMARAGYDPHAMIQMMQILQSQQKYQPMEFFSTHPSPENRIGYIREKVERKYSNTEGMITGDNTYKQQVLDNL